MASQLNISSKLPVRQHAPLALAYALMIGGMVGAFMLIRAFGEKMSAAPAALVRSGHADANAGTVGHVLLALLIIVVLARVVGNAFRVLHQPPVVGEIIAGILLGPSFLGRFAPSLSAYVLPASISPFLNVLAQVGVVLYMFLVGLELDPALLKRRGHAAVAISHASIITPFIMGAALSLILFPRLGTASVRFTSFALFLGVSMSVTAFPVLARILTDRGIHKTRMGAIALTCAAVDDVTAWCMLAFVVAVIQSRTAGFISTFGGALAFIAAMLWLIRPLMVRLTLVYGNRGRLTQGLMASVFVALLLSAWATDLIGIHAVFGAFALGAMIPHDSGLACDLTDRLEDLLVVLFLPAFFAYTGLRTQIGLVSGAEQWVLCVLITLIASAGKFGGSVAAAWLTGLGWRDASALGVLMNTRGLVELIVLNIGLDFGVISPTVFAMLVLMALVTTLATTPVLDLIGSELTEDRSADAKPRHAEVSATERQPMLVAISNPRAIAALLDVAAYATEPGTPVLHVLALVHRPAGGVRSGLRERNEHVSPQAPILLSAVDHARRLGLAVETMSKWTDDPAADIVRSALEIDAGWILIGFHEPAFGTDGMGGTVRAVLQRTNGMPIHVGVITRGEPGRIERIFALIDNTADGRAALDLGLRIARKCESSLHALLMSQDGGEPEPALKQLLRDASRASGKWLYTDILQERSPRKLIEQTPGQLVIVGRRIVDEMALPINMIRELDGERCMIVVQGSNPQHESAAV
jgi:Kef-type K+ transport system membrane component KefB